MLHGLGFDTGVDLAALIATGQWISVELGRDNGARLGRALAPGACA
jgi:hydroxymethylglutaryl-CoA lyase